LKGAPSPARVYLIDTSVITRTDHAEIAEIVDGLLSDRAAATCVTLDLEMGFSSRGYSEVRSVAEFRRSQFLLLPITEHIADRAREVQLNLAARGSHRSAGVIDLLTAAVAEHYGAVILHYDADFEHVAAVTGQPHMWVVPRGRI
jgi:predicted nucleic acid-binding protein